MKSFLKTLARGWFWLLHVLRIRRLRPVDILPHILAMDPKSCPLFDVNWDPENPWMCDAE
jgi:hypothetical protein